MVQQQASFWRRHMWLTRIAVACLAVLVAVTVTLAVLAHHFQPFLRATLVQVLQDRFHARVELDDFNVALGNGLNGEWGIWAHGKGLRVWPPERTAGDQPLEIVAQSVPLISLDAFGFHVPLHYERGRPIKISRVRLEGLKIVVPPRRAPDTATAFAAMTKHKPSAGQARHTYTPGSPAPGPTAERAQTAPSNAAQSGAGALPSVVVERIDCENAQLILETNKPDKLPLGFEIARLELRDVTAGRPAKFEAELTNPKPKGLIHTQGTVGPWQPDDPGETPVNGTYTFDHADLATLRGIAGILSSTGAYQGTLQDIAVQGTADVPDFRLPQFGNTEGLHTTFHARVDGTDGDTWLDPVDATLGHSHFITRGQIVRVRPPALNGSLLVASANLPPLADYGHDIKLTVDVDRGRIEDFLRLASKPTTPILTGNLTTKASLHIPPGKEPAHQRLVLEGEFKLEDARFTDARIQSKIEELSLRGLGHPQEIKTIDPNQVSSEMDGAFHMANAVITLPEIHYNVPGAQIQLQGRYPLEGSIHFEGTARMQATVSQMVGGWKGWLLKPADRFFKKDGAGTEVPILIQGSHEAPKFSVDFNRMKHTSPETPGSKNQGNGK